MKKVLLIICALLLTTGAAMAQKYAVIDSEYILKKMSKYKTAQDQIDKFATQLQKEVDEAYKQVDDMYRTYQAEKMLLSDELKRKREDQIIAKEKDAKDLQRKHFGPDGTLFKKREELMKPIQDQLYNAIKDMATEGSYAVVFDSANNPSLIYINPRYDKSDDVLKRLGF